MINYILREYLDIFVVAYLNDILIYSDDSEKHPEYIYKVVITQGQDTRGSYRRKVRCSPSRDSITGLDGISIKEFRITKNITL